MKSSQNLIERIVVGVRLDPFFQPRDGLAYSYEDEGRRLIRAAQAIAKRSGASIRLVSICEESAFDVTSAATWTPSLSWRSLNLPEIMKAARKEACASSKRQLDALAQGASPEVEITTHVLISKFAAQGLLAEAIIQEASLILLGAGTKGDNYFTRGYSTPLAVMAETTVPTLVIGHACEADFTRPRLRVLVADDLREETARAMQGAVDWAMAVGSTDVFHVHIEELSADGVRQVLGQAVPELRSTADSTKLAADLVQALETAFRSRLAQRIQGADERLRAAGGSFRFEVRRCPYVRDEIERAADEFGADLIVFGRHQKVHRRPYLVGRVTYQAMLSQKRAVMIIP